MLKTVTIRTTIPELRKKRCCLNQPTIEAGYQLLLTMGDQAVHLPSGSPTDIAANHDDYLYDEL